MGTYAEYLERRAQADGAAGFDPLWLPGLPVRLPAVT